MKYLNLPEKPINPGHAKRWALLLCIAAALIAAFTIKSNFDYFAQYHTGFAFYVRVAVFACVELAIISLPLTKGWGNWHQQLAALGCEVILISLSLFHTSLVGNSLQAKIVAEKTRAQAQSDFDRANGVAARIVEQNRAQQDSYNRALANWNRAAANARAMRQSAPPAPDRPQMLVVPQVSQSLTDQSTLNVEQVGEQIVAHGTLQLLLYLMLGAVILTAGLQAYLADSSRLCAWLLKRRAVELGQLTADVGVAMSDTRYPAPLIIPASAPPIVTGQEPPRVMGFAPQTVGQSVPQSVNGSVVQSVSGSVQTMPQTVGQTVSIAPTVCGVPTRGGYSLQTVGGEYLCYLPKSEAERLGNLSSSAILAQIRGRVEARADRGNKPRALSEIDRLISEHR